MKRTLQVFILCGSSAATSLCLRAGTLAPTAQNVTTSIDIGFLSDRADTAKLDPFFAQLGLTDNGAGHPSAKGDSSVNTLFTTTSYIFESHGSASRQAGIQGISADSTVSSSMEFDIPQSTPYSLSLELEGLADDQLNHAQIGFTFAGLDSQTTGIVPNIENSFQVHLDGVGLYTHTFEGVLAPGHYSFSISGFVQPVPPQDAAFTANYTANVALTVPEPRVDLMVVVGSVFLLAAQQFRQRRA